MYSYFYSFFYNDEKNDFEKETILESNEKKKISELIRNLEKQNKKTVVNIEKCISSKNTNQLKLIRDALTDLFMQSKFMLKQISKIKDKNIDQENQIYIQEMLTNITELNNIFDTVYGRVKYKN